MKHILYILTALFMIASCGPDDPQTETVRLSVDKTSLEFTAEGGDQTFTVTASEQVYIVPGENWIKFRKGAAGSDNTFLRVLQSGGGGKFPSALDTAAGSWYNLLVTE